MKERALEEVRPGRWAHMRPLRFSKVSGRSAAWEHPSDLEVEVGYPDPLRS